MHALMLAAGIGARLAQIEENHPPKCLLEFDGKSLLARHIEILQASDIEKLTLVVGHRADDIKEELSKIGATDFVETVTNPDYREGSILSLSCAAKTMRAGSEVLFMDADVLYHPDLIHRLTRSSAASCILFDPDFEPGDEPVKLCMEEGQIVEFRKKVEIAFDSIGEWPGFVKWSPEAATHIADIIERFIAAGSTELPYEEAFRTYLLGPDGASVACENISGLPWIEIDFPEDIERARTIILPAIR